MLSDKIEENSTKPLQWLADVSFKFLTDENDEKKIYHMATMIEIPIHESLSFFMAMAHLTPALLSIQNYSVALSCTYLSQNSA